MRAHADFSIAPDFHAHQRLLDSGNRLATAEHNDVIDQCDSILDSHHLFGELLCLEVIERHFDALLGGGFKVNNPRAVHECACGESFSI